MQPLMNAWPNRRNDGWQAVNLDDDFDVLNDIIIDHDESSSSSFFAKTKIVSTTTNNVKKKRAGRWRSRNSQFAQYARCLPNNKYEHLYRADDEENDDDLFFRALGRQKSSRTNNRRLRLKTTVDVFVYDPVEVQGPVVSKHQVENNRKVVRTLKQFAGNGWHSLDEDTTNSILNRHVDFSSQAASTQQRRQTINSKDSLTTSTNNSVGRKFSSPNYSHHQNQFAGLGLAAGDGIKSMSSSTRKEGPLHFRWNVMVS